MTEFCGDGLFTDRVSIILPLQNRGTGIIDAYGTSHNVERPASASVSRSLRLFADSESDGSVRRFQ